MERKKKTSREMTIVNFTLIRGGNALRKINERILRGMGGIIRLTRL
jgi:hypothetical protein